MSVATASRVLSGSEYPVSRATRARVLDAAAALEYSPNALAKAMATGRTGIVGVLVGDASDPYFAAIVRGIEDVARQHGKLVVVCNSDRDPAIELQYLRALNDYRVDGLIFAGGGLTDDGYVREIRKADRPVPVTRRRLRRPRRAPLPVVPRPHRQRAGRARRRRLPLFAGAPPHRVPLGAAAPHDDRAAACGLPRGRRRARPRGGAGLRPRGRLYVRRRRPGRARHPRAAAQAELPSSPRTT